MHAVANQSGSTRISPLVVAVAASVAIVSLVGVGALTGMLPDKRSPVPELGPLPKIEPRPAPPSACALCGTIESIRTVEVSDDAGAVKRYAYRVTVRMDDGSFRAVSSSSAPAFAVGDKVRVVEGRLVGS